MRELERDPPTSASRRSEALPALAIVGAGRIGGSLHRSATAAGLEVALAGRDDALEACGGAEAALLCVPDTSIVEAAAAIAAAVPPLRFVGHVSGATGLDALAPASERGARAFSLHPLQTAPGPVTDLIGAPCAVAGSDAEAEAFAATLAGRLGMRAFAIPEGERAVYHAAACIASNFLVALEQSAVELLHGIGIADAREILAPLVLRTAANWAEVGEQALTGPIARGDEATVARHLEALRSEWPELVPLYEALAERTRELADGRIEASL